MRASQWSHGRTLAAGTVGGVHVDLLFDPFGGRWKDLCDATVRAEEAGFDGVWLYDHLAGSAHASRARSACRPAALGEAE
jgi:alkanesulfonate monooxygenase SsuD/methylene tetrahydromethanopterin reductase-like flavin-dependent oxidoreductase (luciferase family)